MLLVGAKLYSVKTDVFNVFESPNYMQMLKEYICGPSNSNKPHMKDIGISCLYFLFKQKEHCMVKYLIEDPSNHDLLLQFLKASKDTTTEHRKSFLVALE